MSVDGKDKIELQDSIDRVSMITSRYYNGKIDKEKAYNKIKEEVKE
jgi:hypothetical protein